MVIKRIEIMKEITYIFLVVFLFNSDVTFSQDGTLDMTFGDHGKVLPTFGQYLSDIKDIMVQPDGKIITAGGIFNQSGYNKFVLVRYNTDGSFDYGFGIEGKVINDFGGYYLDGMLLQLDGKIIIGTREFIYFDGDYTWKSFLARYNTDGTLDITFGDNGVITKMDNAINSLALQPDGKIIVAESFHEEPNLSWTSGLIRYDSDGILDTNFGVNGYVTTTMSGKMTLQTDGKILISSSYSSNQESSDFAFIRYLNDGTIDSAFGINGIAMIDIDVIDYLSSVEIQPDGKIVFVGRSYHYIDPPYTISNYLYKLIRLLPNGDLDVNFGKDGMITLPILPDSIAIQSNGKVVVNGRNSFVDPYGFTLDQIGLLRCLDTGDPDSTFGDNGLILIPNEGLGGGNMGSLTALQPDGKLVIGATFCEAHLSCHPHSVLLRYNLGQGLSNTELIAQKNTFLAYPNPVNSIVNLDFNLNESEVLSIDLYDSNGRKISNLLKNNNFQTGYNSQKLELPETLSKGIYFLNISNGKNVSNIKIVK